MTGEAAKWLARLRATAKARGCVVCGSIDRVQRFEIRVDGEALRLQPDLCRNHGDAFLIRAGLALGDMFHEKSVDEADS